MTRRHDLQKQNVYRWERAFVPKDKSVTRVLLKNRSFSPEFLNFYETVWRWGVERYGYHTDELPPLKRNLKMTRKSGYAGFINAGNGIYKFGIKLGWPRKDVLLHEMAHIFAGTGHGHGPLFCRVALDLYIKYLGVNETQALALADAHGVEIEDQFTLAKVKRIVDV